MMKFGWDVLWCMAPLTTKGRPPSERSDFLYLFEEGCVVAWWEHGFGVSINHKGEWPGGEELCRVMPFAKAKEKKDFWFNDVDPAVPAVENPFKNWIDSTQWKQEGGHFGQSFTRKLAAVFCAWSQIASPGAEPAWGAHDTFEGWISPFNEKRVQLQAEVNLTLPASGDKTLLVLAESYK